jgi:hypothetical protein
MASIDERFDAMERAINVLLEESSALLKIAKGGTTKEEDKDIGFLRECQMLVDDCGMPSSMQITVWIDGTFNFVQNAFRGNVKMQRGDRVKLWPLHKTASAIEAMKRADWVEVEP